MKLTKRKKEILREFVDYTCEGCNKHEEIVGTLEVHRIKRGNSGGLYTLNNIKMACNKCHKSYHQMEFK